MLRHYGITILEVRFHALKELYSPTAFFKDMLLVHPLMSFGHHLPILEDGLAPLLMQAVEYRKLLFPGRLEQLEHVGNRVRLLQAVRD